MHILKNTKDVKKKTGLRNLATISYETLQFLDSTSCCSQTKEKVVSFLKQIKNFKLTKTECMMMINNPPSSQLHIQLLIEDSEERLTETDVHNIIQIVSQTLLKQD